ncbi:uncharacterized protein GGS22DRAFT_134243 [Annulohypoxylon maeteangense]|uniref:uncharacterized protein n=1 Tax=Annulohypoxylon maeteangense TaxID=1927788 RepID=UPI0020072DF2|nr:uncharacterized protein GGS22DRAFT_134243 [Annulohypoxylon maeteangense]KAI0885763.1 hypothetical protein GGS22DRAFT_134243 [Annulohypoxylon maeteangense]
MKSPSVPVSSLCAWLILTNLCESSSFKPNCTLPTTDTNYVSGSTIRSTLGILWNCTSVIILCTWNIQHLNVPAFRRADGIKKVWIAIVALTTRVKWMVFTIFVPEYFVGKALSELCAAYYTSIEMKDQEYMAGKEWGIVHSYLANMGYFVLDTQQLEFDATPSTSPDDQSSMHSTSEPKEHPQRHEVLPSQDDTLEPQVVDTPSLNHSPHEARINRMAQKPTMTRSVKINIHRLKYRYWALSSSQWQYLFENEIAAVPNIPSIYLERLDKGGMLVKLLAVGQVSYLVIQLISRKIQDLPSSQLEIGTLAFSVSSLITYGLYWKHPQGVDVIHIIPTTGKRLDGWDIAELAQLGPKSMWNKLRTKSDFDPELGPSPIPNDSSHYEEHIWTFGTIFSGIPFGGLHCLAWRFQFPTTVEAVLWRVCSVVTTCLPLVAMIPLLIWLGFIVMEHEGLTKDSLRLDGKFGTFRLTTAYIVLMLLLIYFLARLFLLCEMIRCLFYLPPEAFIDTWSNAFPHWG